MDPHASTPTLPGPVERSAASGDCSDETLLLKVARERDREALAELVTRHASMALGLAGKLCGCRDQAEEALQEAFLRVWQAAGSYEPGGNPRGWLMAIVVRETLKQTRSRIRRTRRDRLGSLSEEAAVCGPEIAPESQELHSGLAKALRALPPAQRELVALYFGAGLSQEQIARRLAVSQRLVSHRLQAALGELRQGLAKLGLLAATGAAFEACVAESLRAGSPRGPLAPALQERLLARTLEAPPAKAGSGQLARKDPAKGILGTALLATAVTATLGFFLSQLAPATAPTPAAIAPLQGEAGHPEIRRAAAFDQPLKAGFEVVYEDEFERTRLDPFWEFGGELKDVKFRTQSYREKAQAPGQPDRPYSATLLTLQAAMPASAGQTAFRETAIRSKAITFSEGRSGRLELDTEAPDLSGLCEYGWQIQEESGQVIWQLGYRVEPDRKNKGFLVTELCRSEGRPIDSDLVSRPQPKLFGSNWDIDWSTRDPAAALPLPADLLYHPEPEQLGWRTRTRTDIRLTAGVRLYCYVRAFPGASITWYLDRCRVSRSIRAPSPSRAH